MRRPHPPSPMGMPSAAHPLHRSPPTAHRYPHPAPLTPHLSPLISHSHPGCPHLAYLWSCSRPPATTTVAASLCRPRLPRRRPRRAEAKIAVVGTAGPLPHHVYCSHLSTSSAVSHRGSGDTTSSVLGGVLATPLGRWTRLWQGKPELSCRGNWYACCHACIARFDRHGVVNMSL